MKDPRVGPIQNLCSIGKRAMLVLLFACGTPAQLWAQDKADKTQVSRVKKSRGKDTCLIEVKNSPFAAGELIEIIDSNGQRIGVAKAGRQNAKNRRAKALILDGTRKCKSYQGQSVRSLAEPRSSFGKSTSAVSDNMLFISPRYVVTQYTLPGLALNKFITPAFNQKGFGIIASGIFPKKPISLGAIAIKANIEVNFESGKSSPPLDLVKDGVVEGTQNIATTLLDVRGGVRALFSNSSSWAELGAVVFERLSTKSTLLKSGDDESEIFQTIRDLSGGGFGGYLGYGLSFGNAAEIALHSGIGFASSYTTPIVEDGNFTNTSEKLEPDGLPVFAGISIKIPLMKFVFTEVDLRYKITPLKIPLINDEVSKAQAELLSIRAGAGLQF